MARINSVIDDEVLRRLRHVLVDERISLSEWIRRMAVAYVEEKEPKDARVQLLVDRRREKRWTDVQNGTGKPKRKGRKGKEG